MRLKTLSGLQREKIEEEYKALMELIAHLREILSSERLVFDIIKEELIQIRDKFGDERKTKIVAAEGEINVEDLIKEEQSVVILKECQLIHIKVKEEAEKELLELQQEKRILLNKSLLLQHMIRYYSLAIKVNCID